MTVPVRATYRVQLHPGFGFDDAAGVIEHLADLGISHLYTSPVFEAVPGSTHGYDITDHSRVRGELGGADGLSRLVQALRRRDMGWIVDLVPNHVSVAVPRANPHWWDLLTHGPGSHSARWFDIDWVASDGRLVLPVLGAPLEHELARGAIELRRRAGEIVIGYHDYEVPTAPGTTAADDVGARGGELRGILDAQHYRLSYWRTGDRNYRVFFDIDSLAAIRVEDSDVFDEVHALLGEWVSGGVVDGVRVDHIDGLADPTAYLRRLRDLVGPDRGIWVEKILSPGEQLPAHWPVDGTTGYDFARVATAVSVDPASEPHFDAAWHACGDDRPYESVEWNAKREALTGRLQPELRRVVGAARDAGVSDPEDVVIELSVALGVYRTYGRGTEPLDARDATLVERAVWLASVWRPDLAGSLRAGGAELLRPSDPVSAEFRSRFQKLTGAAMAKGAEDTAFYRYHRFVALNEVGGEPARFGTDPSEFHDHARRILARHPGSMLAASTHDTKRSADVRARITVLSQQSDRWHAALDDLHARAAAFHPPLLDTATEHLAWQTLVGAWPIDGDRLAAYLAKAARESGRQTSWTDIDEDYEQAVTAFAHAVVADGAVVSVVEELLDELAPIGRAVRLGEIVLRFTAPGTPDVYQGDQDWDLSLVDPDNRRPVDHDRIARRLRDAVATADVDEFGVDAGSLAKLWVTHRLLSLRAEHPGWFGADARYEPLTVTSGDDGIVAYQRGDVVVTVNTRPGLPGREGSVEIPAGNWRDVLRRSHHLVGGRDVPVAELWPVVPVSVLVPA